MSNLERSGSLVPLRWKSDWQQLEERGDYAFTEGLGLTVLVMRCPFCNTEAPFPPTECRVVKKNPLTIEGSVYCLGCRETYTIRDGVAFGLSSIL
jgi:uncharacterized protein YbaR (Trm112 family)